MRLTYLDILEQCFHDKFRGYNKEEVDSFLQLVAKDYKEMTEEIEKMKRDLERKSKKIDDLEKKLAQAGPSSNGNGTVPKEWSPEAIRQRAEGILQMAREQANQHRQKAEKDLIRIQEEVKLLQEKKQDMLENLKAGAKSYLKSLQKQPDGAPDP